MKPIIGITFSSKTIKGTSKNYIHAIEEFGGIPHSLYPGISEDAFTDIDGLLLTGGLDIDPIHYGEEPHETTDIDPNNRYELELRLFKWAMEEDLPVFGICLGIQVISVATRGSLYQDIPSQFSDHLPHKVKHGDSWHDIKIQPQSLLNQITSDNIAEVNSSHHQSVKDIGDGLVVTAQSEDGIIEAIENPSKRFVLGVQYHPERMFKEPGSLELKAHAAKLFEAFIAAASE